MQEVNKYYLADWMAGKMLDSELKNLVSEEDYIAYLKIKNAMNSAQIPEFDTNERFRELQLLIQQDNKGKLISRNNWFYAIAASVILLLGITYFITANDSVITHIGQQRELVLNDNTHVVLNAVSNFSYPKYQSQRKVYLQGEAFFEVTKKGDYQVITPNGVVRVLGTKFNVISEEDYFEVICIEGKVSVETKQEKIVLTPGKAWRSIHGITKSWNISKDAVTWLQGESTFRSVPLHYVLKSFENQYGVNILKKNINTDVIFTGSFTHKDIKIALKSVCIPLGLDYRIVSEKEIVLTKS